MAAPPPPTAAPPFTSDPSLQEWTLDAATWLQNNTPSILSANKRIDGLASGNAVFNPATNKLLLVQRAAHDSSPNRWEIPGGAVDPEDASILHGAARELLEETGLVAGHFSHIVSVDPAFAGGFQTMDVFPNRHATRYFGRIVFVVEARGCEGVVLDRNEHQDYVWAGEEEVRDERRSDGREMPITHVGMKRVLLEAFRIRRERGGKGE